MVRGVYIQRSGSERMTLEKALERYLADVTPTKKPSTRKAEATKAKQLIEHLGKYSLAALSAERKRRNDSHRGKGCSTDSTNPQSHPTRTCASESVTPRKSPQECSLRQTRT
ncbi:hypothetical protein D9M71_435090 [compost metagenome]